MTVRSHPILAGPNRKPNRRIRVALYLEEWPVEDRTRWAQATTQGDLFDDAAPGAHLSPRTCGTLIRAYGRWLGFLSKAEPDCLIQCPGQRVSRERIERFCNELAETNTGLALAIQLRHIRYALMLIVPELGWAWLLTIAKQIEAQSSPRSKRGRLRLSDDLYELGLTLIREAEEIILVYDRVSKDAAVTYRDGLIIALLALAPLRRRNLQDLRLGETLVRFGSIWNVVFRSHETKSGQDLEYPVPEELSMLLDRYISGVRPVLFGARSHRGVWASAKGCPLTGNGLYAAVCRRTAAAFGQSVNLHLFRDAAATFIAVTAPEKARVASDLLGHARQMTTGRHYTHAQAIRAGRSLADVISRMRVDLNRANG